MKSFVCGLALAFVAAPAAAEDSALKKAARGVLAKYHDAVISVKFVVKTAHAQGDQAQLEVAGTVLTPAGLTVVSDFTSNPSGFFFESDEDKSETSDVKLILKGGQEIPAKFVLRDRELDLAFVMPKEAKTKFTSVPLEKGPTPAVLDDLIYLFRFGKTLNREPALTLGRVESVIKKPRTLIVPDLIDGVQGLGSPVFDGSGRPLGIVVMRRSAMPPRSITSVRDVLDLLKPVVVTAEDIQRAAAQIGKPDEKQK
jgi:hypothetical protein